MFTERAGATQSVLPQRKETSQWTRCVGGSLESLKQAGQDFRRDCSSLSSGFLPDHLDSSEPLSAATALAVVSFFFTACIQEHVHEYVYVHTVSRST